MVKGEPMKSRYLLALEGGGTRCQAVILDHLGRVVHETQAGAVNTNFVSMQEAKQAVLEAVLGVLEASQVGGGSVDLFASALVGPRFDKEFFGEWFPQAQFVFYNERDVVFARAGCYLPHGVGVVAATGATAWAVRQDDGRQIALGGLGALLGDEGSAYSIGLLGLRAAARAFEGRLDVPTNLVESLAEQLNLGKDTFNKDLVRLVYGKPFSRRDVAGLAPLVTRLAQECDPAAVRIVAKVAEDLKNLAVHAARRLFSPEEAFDLVIAGGVVNAGELVLAPLRSAFQEEFAHARMLIGSEDPAVALGRLALFHHNRSGIEQPPA
jgi:N-acetylglucosamine kinase-like BadF-type ATPase